VKRRSTRSGAGGAFSSATAVRGFVPRRETPWISSSRQQPRDPLAPGAHLVLVAKLVVDAHRPVDLVRTVVDLHDQPLQPLIAQLSQARPAPPPAMKALTRDADHLAEQGDRMLCLLRLDQPVLHRR
jgi:hypothetical protein